jgi:hypothetical protein
MEHFPHFFSLCKSEAVNKFKLREEKASLVARPPHFPVPEFFHNFRGMKGDFVASQKVKLLRSIRPDAPFG